MRMQSYKGLREKVKNLMKLMLLGMQRYLMKMMGYQIVIVKTIRILVVDDKDKEDVITMMQRD